MKSISILLLSILVFSTGIPSFGQNARSGDKDVQFERIDALSEGEGVLLRWEMKAGTPTLGFFVFRIGGGGLEPVNESLIVGSLTKRWSETEVAYDLYDEQGVLGSSYVIQVLNTDGRRISSDIIGAKYSASLEAESGLSRESLEKKARSKKGLVENNRLALTRDLAKAVSSFQAEANLTEHLRVVGLPGAKIGVKKEGFHRVLRSQLPQGVGFDAGSNSANWRLFVEGNEQAIIVGPNDEYIEFYGKGIDRPESDTRIYYLIADTTAGKRIEPKILRAVGGTVVSNNYRFAAEKKERIVYDRKVKNGDEENYFGRSITSDFPDPAIGLNTVKFNLSGVDLAGSDAVVTIKLQGILLRPHEIIASLNNNSLGIFTGENFTSFSGTFTVPSNFLVEGENSLGLRTASSADVVLFDSVNVTYSRRFVADQNRIAFFTPGYRRADVVGFASPNVRVFDTLEEGNPRQIANLQVTQDGTSHTAKLPSSRASVFNAVEDSALLPAASITVNTPSTLSSGTNQADYVIISATDLVAASEAWANYRRTAVGGGFVVKVIDVADIFDEFNYGVFSSSAIKNFLEHSRNNWQIPKPQYVLLMGDATWDPRNYEGHGVFNAVPTRLIELIFEESGSDDALGDFNGDGLAELPIGRIPARTSDVVTIVLNKTIAFETTAAQSLSRGVIFAYDNPISYDFEAMSVILRNELNISTPVTMIMRGPQVGNFDEGHEPLIAAINSGKFLVNYSGHGATGTWGGERFFANTDVPGLTNANNLSVFTMLTCYNGFFILPNSDSIAENLLKLPNGGAVAAWASSSLTPPDNQLTMGTRFYNRIGAANPSITRLGDLVRDAKTTIAGSDVAYSWTLLGDPALKVR